MCIRDSIKKSTETDSRCLEILLSILDQQLPHGIKDKLLSAIRKELTERDNSCRAVVPLSQNSQLVASGDFPKECAVQQSSLLGRLEDSLRQHERACAEKNLLEERLKKKSEKCERLKNELEALKSQTQEAASTHKYVANVQGRLSACESGITNLKTKINELENTIQEQSMQAKRGRSTVLTKTKELFAHLYVALQENEAVAQKRVEEMRQKELKHELAIKDKELRIRELKVENKQHKESLSQQEIRMKEERKALQAMTQKRTEDEIRMRDLEQRMAIHAGELSRLQ